MSQGVIGMSQGVNWYQSATVPSSWGGVDASSRRCREASLLERTGWSITETASAPDHPVCAAAEASRLFVTGAATPPHEEGTAGAHRYQPL